MKTSVLDIFSSFSVQLEGYVPYMYLDIKGLVTIGIGNLIDPVRYALSLPFIKEDGEAATDNDIILEWRRIKLNTQLAKQGHEAAAKLAKLRLTRESINKLVKAKIIANEKFIKDEYFKFFDDFPADAQLAIMSMAWAVGAGFPRIFRKFTQHVSLKYWSAAAEECYINSKGNPGIVPRNKVNKNLLLAAQYVVQSNLNPEVIYGLQKRGVNRPESTT